MCPQAPHSAPVLYCLSAVSRRDFLCPVTADLTGNFPALFGKVSGGGTDRIGMSVHRIAGDPDHCPQQHHDSGNPADYAGDHVYWCHSTGRTAESGTLPQRYHLERLFPQHDHRRRTAAAVSAAGLFREENLPQHCAGMGGKVPAGQLSFRAGHGSAGQPHGKSQPPVFRHCFRFPAPEHPAC